MVDKLETSVRKASRLGQEVVWAPMGGLRSPNMEAQAGMQGERKLLSSLIPDNVIGIEASGTISAPAKKKQNNALVSQYPSPIYV